VIKFNILEDNISNLKRINGLSFPLSINTLSSVLLDRNIIERKIYCFELNDNIPSIKIDIENILDIKITSKSISIYVSTGKNIEISEDDKWYLSGKEVVCVHKYKNTKRVEFLLFKNKNIETDLKNSSYF
jgi:hypothetical protein